MSHGGWERGAHAPLGEARPPGPPELGSSRLEFCPSGSAPRLQSISCERLWSVPIAFSPDTCCQLALCR